jgi:hypothetical protein
MIYFRPESKMKLTPIFYKWDGIGGVWRDANGKYFDQVIDSPRKPAKILVDQVTRKIIQIIDGKLEIKDYPETHHIR